MNKIYIYYIAVFLLTALAGCTKVDLCDNKERPHLSQVTFSYNWDGFDKEKPDSMYVVVSRIVDTYHDAFRLSFDGDPATRSEEPEASAIGTQGVKSGEYFMMTFNKSERLIIQNLDTFLLDKQISLKDLSIRMKTLETSEIPQLGNKPWVDFNPGYSYVSNEGMVFLDKVNNVKLFTGIPASQSFNPKPLTQKVNIKFQLVMLPDPETNETVELEDVIAEMSGVATTVYPVSGVVRVNSLGKFIFRPERESQKDSVYNYKGTINAFGLLPGTDLATLSGSGIMRLGLYVKVGEEKRIVRVSVNLSQKISEAQLTRYSEDGTGLVKAKEEAVIVVEQRLRIKPEVVTKDKPDGVSGWHVDKIIDFDV